MDTESSSSSSTSSVKKKAALNSVAVEGKRIQPPTLNSLNSLNSLAQQQPQTQPQTQTQTLSSRIPRRSLNSASNASPNTSNDSLPLVACVAPAKSTASPSDAHTSILITPQLALAHVAVQRWKRFVLSNKADRIAASVLLKRTVKHWRNASLFLWRRGIKAHVHHKVSVYNSCWNQWSIKMKEKLKEKEKWERAVQFASSTLKAKCIQYWKMYRDHRRIQNLRNKFAASSHQSILSNSMFRVWIRKYRHIVHCRDMENLSVKADALRLRKAGWKRWTALAFRNNRWNQKVARFVKTHQVDVTRNIMNGWKEYVITRRMKLERKDQADLFRAKSLTTAALTSWMRLYNHRKTVEKMKLEASDFSTHHQLCRNFAKWKAATQKTRTDRNNQQLAELHHMRQLKKQILTRLNTVNGWIKLADSKRRMNLLGVFLSKWRYRTTGSLSRKEGAYLEPGKVHHETKLKQQVFYAWINFVTIEKAEREKEKQATTFHANRLLQFTFEVFHKKYRLRRLQIEMQILATRHHAFTITYKSFETWIARMQDAYRERQNMKKVARFRKHVLLRNCFHALMENRDWEARERENEQRATVHHNRHLAQRALSGWMHVTATANDRAIAKRTAVHHHYINTLTTSFTKWMRAYIEHRRNQFRMEVAAARHDKLNLAEKWRAWKRYTDESKAFRQNVEDFMERVEKGVVRQLLIKWREKYSDILEERKRRQEYEEVQKRELMKKVLRAWNIFAVDRVVRRSELRAQISQVESALLQARLRRCFRNWVIYHSIKCDKKLRDTDATLFRVTKSKLNVFQIWRRKFENRIWEKQSVQLAIKYHTKNLLTHHVSKWTNSRVDWSQLYTNRHVTPVLHWSQTLTRRAFTSWRTYIQTRRSKASLMTSAETWRQETTMRDACVMWMIGADKLRRVREGWRAEERVRDVEREVRKVRKFALRWRAKTVAAREKRKGKAFDVVKGLRSAGSSSDSLWSRSIPPSREHTSWDYENWNPSPPVRSQPQAKFRNNAEVYDPPKPIKVRTQPRKPDFLDDLLRK